MISRLLINWSIYRRELHGSIWLKDNFYTALEITCSNPQIQLIGKNIRCWKKNIETWFTIIAQQAHYLIFMCNFNLCGRMVLCILISWMLLFITLFKWMFKSIFLVSDCCWLCIICLSLCLIVGLFVICITWCVCVALSYIRSLHPFIPQCEFRGFDSSYGPGTKRLLWPNHEKTPCPWLKYL